MKPCGKIAKEAMKIRNFVIDRSIEKITIMLRNDIRIFFFENQTDINGELYFIIREKIDESY